MQLCGSYCRKRYSGPRDPAPPPPVGEGRRRPARALAQGRRGGAALLHVPEDYGGLGLDYLFDVVVFEELARSGFTGPGSGFMVHADLVATYIRSFGSEEQKRTWLPRMVKGEAIGAAIPWPPPSLDGERLVAPSGKPRASGASFAPSPPPSGPDGREAPS